MNLRNFIFNFYRPQYIILISFLVFILSIRYSSTNPDLISFISSILQTLASLLAIITAFTLIAVQLSSQTYSPRILKMFLYYKSNKVFTILILLYLATMIYFLFLLNSFDKIGQASFSQIILINIGLLLAFWCYFSLPGYIFDTVNRLRPEEVMKELNKLINKDLLDNIVYHSNKKDIPNDCHDIRHIPSEDDPLIPLVDIVIGAIKEGYEHTAVTGLRFICNSFKKLTDNNSINNSNGKQVYQYLLEHLERINYYAIRNRDSKIVNLLIEIIRKIGISISKKVPDCNLATLRFLGDMSSDIIIAEFELEVLQIIILYDYLIDEYLNNIKINDKIPWHIYLIIAMANLKDLLINSTEEGIINIKNNALIKISEKYEMLIQKGFLDLLSNEIFFLMNFSISIMDKDIVMLDEILSIYDEIYKSLFNQYISTPILTKKKIANSLIVNIIESLKNIGQESIYKNLYDLQIGSYIPLGELVNLKKPLISIILNLFGDILISYLNVEYKEYLDKSDPNIFDKIIMRNLNYIEDFSVLLAQKRSFSITYSIEILNRIMENLSILNKEKELQIISKIVDIYISLFNAFLENKFYDNISDCILNLEKILKWSDKNEVIIIKDTIIKKLGNIGQELIDNNKIKELKLVIEILEKRILESIDLKSEKFTRLYLLQLQNILEYMFKINFDDLVIEYVFEKLNFMKDQLRKAEMENIYNDLNIWMKNFNN